MRLTLFLLSFLLVWAVFLAVSYAVGRYFLQPWRARGSISAIMRREREWRYRRK